MYSGTKAGAALRRTASAGEYLGRSMWPEQIGGIAMRPEVWRTEAGYYSGGAVRQNRSGVPCLLR